jgi:predicted amidohydrolase YtcJ
MVYDLLVNNALLFDGSAVRDGLLSVGIAGNKISFVGASAAQASKEIDAAGRFLMPGLIDCHVHLMNMWTAKDEATMAVDIERELPNRLRDLLARGVTTVKSAGDSEDDILRVREMLANGGLVGPRLLPQEPHSPLPAAIPQRPSTVRIPGCGTGPLLKATRRGRREKLCAAKPTRKSMRSRLCTKAVASMANRTSARLRPGASKSKFSDSRARF